MQPSRVSKQILQSKPLDARGEEMSLPTQHVHVFKYNTQHKNTGGTDNLLPKKDTICPTL